MSLTQRNYGLDLVRATEAAAIAAGRWMGLGRGQEADSSAGEALARVLLPLDLSARIAVGDTHPHAQTPLRAGVLIGTQEPPAFEVLVDPIDGINLLSEGRPGAISVAGLAPYGSLLDLHPARYMDKLVVDREVGEALVPECLDAPAAWTLALVARIKKKAVRDLVVFVLDRPRHEFLIEEIRSAGARVMLRIDGDIAGALLAASTGDYSIDILMGIGGVSEGLIAACGVRALGGAMLGRLAPQSPEEHQAVRAAGLELDKIYRERMLASSQEVFLAATGITDGPLLQGVHYRGDQISTESLLLRGETQTRRTIRAQHLSE